MSEPPDLAAVREAVVEAGEPDPGDLTATPIPGGASRELWALAVGDRPRYVLRRDPVGDEPQTSRLAEFAVQRAAFEAGVPVPRPIACEDAGGRFKTAGMVMAWVDGDAIPRRVLRGGALRAGQLGAALRALSAVDTAGVPGIAPADPYADALDMVRSLLDSTGDALPALELGLRWLDLNRPAPGEVGVVHGDFRLGNFLVGDAGLVAVIDWEFWHLGDPVEDIAWVCARPWRFGADDRIVAGVGDLDELLDACGAPVEPGRLRWWDVLSQAKWAAYCAQQAALRRSGAHASLERTVLARRVAEAEWDMLELMERA
jgi:aminoglycoside phosphotransferase (APT) family kinase protein